MPSTGSYDLINQVKSDEGYISEKDTRRCITKTLADLELSGRVVAIIPDLTRTAPVDLFFKSTCDVLLPELDELDFLVALGTHPKLDDEDIAELTGMGKTEREELYGDKVEIYNHKWNSPEELKCIGKIDSSKVGKISEGMMEEEINIEINKCILNCDHVLVFGPVYPHEVTGFSGGYKYFLPGVSGPEIIDKFHWLGALLTVPQVIGKKWTAPREIINLAGSFVDVPITAFNVVLEGDRPCGIFCGEIEKSWSRAVDLSSKRNIRYKDRKFDTVIAKIPDIYQEIWTAGKGAYKLTPIVKDGGDLILYGPHIDAISETHGEEIKKVGYHVIDYFLERPERFSEISPLVQAHSSHVKGVGEINEGVESPRINVKLATNISEEICREVNLNYVDPDKLNFERYKKNESALVVENAGEQLYRVSNG